tara:strand:- start:59311 stop:59484 length:174 start_codon:yes stop_codon:yes gene_type:complete
MDSVRAILSLVVLFFVVSVIINGCNGTGYNKEAEDAYQRLRDQGFTAKQIYEMGKDK